jgi:glycerophosphoryl diester phosphodiesterase
MKILFRIIKWFIIVLFILVLSITVLNVIPVTPSKVSKNNPFIKEGKYPLIIPHGGAKKLAPENTIYAYDMLIYDFDADVLEIDLSLTSDNILIAHHDLFLHFSDESEMNGKLIKDYTYEEILNEYENDDYYLARNFVDPNGDKPFENSTKEQLSKMVPANLEEDIFKKVGDSVLYILEIKDSPTSEGYEGGDRYKVAAQILIDLVYKYGLENNVVLASFSDDVTTYFRENAPEMLMNAGVKETTNFAVFSAFHIDFFWNVNSEVLILPNRTSMEPISGSTASLLDMLPGFIKDKIGIKVGDVYEPNLMHSQIINDAHRKNMAVLYWTINDPEEMRLLIELGADGIITDRPDLLKQIIDELRLKD